MKPSSTRNPRLLLLAAIAFALSLSALLASFNLLP